MINDLAGRTFLVTGANTGIGRATAEGLARRGGRVYVASRSAEKGAAAVAGLRASTGNDAVEYLPLDLADLDSVRACAASFLARGEPLHVLVNNAGVVVVANPETTTLEQFRFANAVMSEGVFLGCRAAIPLMHRSGGGSIVNMSSVASHLGYPVFFAYSAAKGAVRAMTKAIAVHCQQNKYGIRCNSIHAGAIETPMVQQANSALGLKMADYEAAPWGLGKPEDVAALVVFLASDESRFVNGAEILIDNALTVQ